MRLQAVSLVLPSRRVSNDDVVALVQRHSESTYAGDLDRVLKRIRVLLSRSGAQSRHWLQQGERPLDLMRRAAEEALRQAECGVTDIDLLIYAGVDRGFVEPAMAYFAARMLGMETVQCFDIVDACNGWSRALQLVDALFRAGAYRRALVINAEFPMFAGGPVFPDLFSLRSSDQLAWTFAGYTLGEGVTATVLMPDAERPWEFHLSSQPHLVDRCTLPLRGYERFSELPGGTAMNGVDRFSAHSGILSSHAPQQVMRLLHELSIPMDEIRAIFPHASSKRHWEESAAAVGASHLMYYVYPRCGNLISASIPAGIARAAEEGRIRRGDRVLGCVASAGMSYAVYSFIY